MIKYFCDRCGKETKMLHVVKIPVSKLQDGSFNPRVLDVCEECENEANDIYDICADLTISVFSKYLTKAVQSDDKLRTHKTDEY